MFESDQLEEEILIEEFENEQVSDEIEYDETKFWLLKILTGEKL